MLPTGLRWRLAAWVATVVVICTAVSFTAVYRGTGTQLRHQIDVEIAGDLDALSHTVHSVHAASTSGKANTSGRASASDGDRRQSPGLASSRQAAELPRRMVAVTRAYVSGQPFSASSTLQFAIVKGTGAPAVTVANRPELLDVTKPDNGENASEQTQENRLSRQLLTVPDGYS